MPSKTIKIRVSTKKIVSIIIPHICGIIVVRITMDLKSKITRYLWAFGTPRKIRGGLL